MDSYEKDPTLKRQAIHLLPIVFLMLLVGACGDMCLISLVNHNAIEPVTLNKEEDYQYELEGNVWELLLYTCDCCSSGLQIRVDNQNPKVADVRVDEKNVLRIKARESGISEVILFAYAYGPENDVTDAIHFTVTVK